MASNVDGSVVLSVDMNVSDAEKKLAQLKSRVFKLEDEISEKTRSGDALKERFRTAEKEFDALNKKKNNFGTMFFSPEEEARMNELGQTMKKLDAEIKKIDEDIDRENISLEWAKQRWAEIYQEAERLKSVQEAAANIEPVEVSNQHIADVNKELAEMKQRQAELKKMDYGAGIKEFDELTIKIAEANREIKEYEKNLTSAAQVDLTISPETDLSGSTAKKVADEMFQDMSDKAAETVRWIERYRDELEDLESRKASLGLALGAQGELAEIESEIDRVTNQLDKMVDELDEMARSGALGALANGSEIAEQRIAELSDELADLQQQQANLGLALGAKQEYEDLSAEIEQVQELIGAYENNLGEDAFLRRMAEDAEVANQHIVDLREELEELEARQKELEGLGLGLGVQEYDDNVSRIAQIKQELKEYEKALKEIKPKEEKTGSILQRLLSVFGDTSALKAAGTAVGSIAQRMGSIFGVVEKAGTAVKNFGKAAVKAFTQAALSAVKLLDKINVFPKMFSSISKSLTKLGQMIRRVFVFSVITSGLRLVRTQMTAYLGVNAQFTNALRQVKGVLLTAFQPIYDVVVPALTTLLNVLARAIAAITQFTAVLFGTTAKQAQQNAKDLYAQANATTAAGDAAEDAALQLASFDEINKLEGNKSAGGGGGASVDTGPLFDWEYEDTPFPDWGEAFSAFLDKLIGNIPKLKETFEGFADWLNGFAQKLYDMFTFPGVLEKVKQLGRDLADAFNYLTDLINWELIGRALGAGLNLALNFLTSFIYTYDWMNLGRHLAEFINGLVYEIDWYEFGRLLWSGFKIGLDTLAGFILGLDIPAMADAATKVITGFFDSMKETIDKINWYEIGEQIRTFLEKIEWDKIADSVFGAIKSAFTASSDFFSGLLGEELKRTLTDMLVEISKYTLVIGAILALSGANIPLGLGLMKVGAASLAAAAALDWEYVTGNIKQIVSDVAGLLGGALLVIGAILTLSGANIPLGLGLMVAGAVSLATALAINWDFIPTTISGIVTTALAILGGALLVLGAILTFSNANIPLGIGLIALGAASLATALAVNWDILPNTISGVISKVTIIISAALLALGAMLTLSTANIPLGLGLMAAGAVGLAAAVAVNWEAIQPKVQSALDGIKTIASGALLALGVVLLLTGAGIPLGLGLIGVGAAGLASIINPNWGGVLSKLKEAMGDIETWWRNGPSKYFSLDFWKGKGEDIMNGLWSGLKSIWNSISSWASGLGSQLSSALSGAKSAVSGIINSTLGTGSSRMSVRTMPEISTDQIPRLAQGAVIPPNREFLAVLGDQRSGNNLEGPESLFRQIVRDENGAMISVLQAILAAIREGKELSVDKTTFAKLVYGSYNKESGRVGVKLAEVRG